MPQPVATFFSAPATPAASLVSTNISKLPDPGGASFKDTLTQAKSKPQAEPVHQSKPAAVSAKKDSKPVASKAASTVKKPAKPASKKPEQAGKSDSTKDKQKVADQSTDDQTDENAGDDPDSDDGAADFSQSDKTDAKKGASDGTDDTAAAQASADLGLTSQQTATAVGKAGDDNSGDARSGKESRSAKDKSADRTASQDPAPGDDPTVAGQLVQASTTASNQTNANAVAVADDSQPDTGSAAAVVSQVTGKAASESRGKSKASAATDAPDASDDQTQDPSAGLAIGAAASGISSGDSGDGPKAQRAGGLTAKAIDDLASKMSAGQSLVDGNSPIQTGQAKAAKSAAAPPEARFAELNHPTIVSDIQGKLLPDGGAMDIHLSPPDLGAMHVRVEVKDGAVTASFQAADPQTAKLLSHSLGDLKSSLEAQGVNVEKLHVTQMPKENQTAQDKNSRNSNREPDQGQQQAAQQEQQRKEMVRKMWRKLMKGQDPLDLVA